MKFNIPILTMLLVISGCSSKPYINSTSPSIILPSSASKAPIPNSITIRRQFEIDIARTLIQTANKAISTQIRTHQSWQAQQKEINRLVKQLVRLDKDMLTDIERKQIHDLVMFDSSLTRQLAAWPERNHLSDINKLLPPETYTRVTKEDLETIKANILYIPESLEALRINLKYQQSFSVEGLTRAKLLCQKLSLSEHNPILDRYQNTLLYSELSKDQQRTDFQSDHKTFNKKILPALKDTCDFIQTLSPSSTQANKAKKEDNKLTLLASALTALDKEITGLLEDQKENNLQELYDAPRHHINQVSKSNQDTLDQMTEFVADLHYGLKLWFINPLYSDVNIAASDNLNLVPFYYDTDTAFFDLELLNELPGFEMEAILYEQSIPGKHILEYDHQYQHDPLWKAYATAWSIYALTLPEPPVYFSHPLSKIAALSRQKLALAKAIADIRLQEKSWSPKQTFTFLQDNTPYPENYLKRELIALISQPGLATSSWFIFEEIKKLRVSNQSLAIKSFHEILLRNSPANILFLKTEMPLLLNQ